MDQLTATLKKIEKQNYRAYQQIKGQYDFTDFTLFIDHVQGDPYASASRFRATRAWSLTGLEWLKTSLRRSNARLAILLLVALSNLLNKKIPYQSL